MKKLFKTAARFQPFLLHTAIQLWLEQVVCSASHKEHNPYLPLKKEGKKPLHHGENSFLSTSLFTSNRGQTNEGAVVGCSHHEEPLPLECWSQMSVLW